MAAEAQSVSSSLATMRAPASETASAQPVAMGFNSQQGFELMQRGAKLLAASTLVPTTYQQNIPNCVIALNMASRLGADPLLVMQNLYVVHGRPAWSAQFLIATFNQCGRFSAIRYKWSGTEGKDDWSCQAYAVEKETGETIVGPVISIALAKKEQWYSKSGSKWQSIPQLMLMYRAAAWLVRTHAPELSMGLQTAEEVHDVYDAQRGGDGSFAVDVDTLREATPQRPAPIEGTAESAGDGLTVETFKALMRDATTREDLNAVWQANHHQFTGNDGLEVEAFRNVRRDELTDAAKGGAK